MIEKKTLVPGGVDRGYYGTSSVIIWRRRNKAATLTLLLVGQVLFLSYNMEAFIKQKIVSPGLVT